MPANRSRWLTAQQAAVELDSTSDGICRLINSGRLSGSKEKQPGRPGKAQWLVSPESIRRELRFRAKLHATQKRRGKSGGARRKSKTLRNSSADGREVGTSTV